MRKKTVTRARKPVAKSLKKRPAARSASIVYRRIGQLYTLDPAARKAGRQIQHEDLGLIENAAMVVTGGRIAWLGPERSLSKDLSKNARTEDLGGAVVIPAFVECHTHLIFAGNRAGEFERRIQGESYQSIAKSGGGIRATVLPTRESSAIELARVGQERADRFIRQGVTTIEAKSGYGLTVDSELNILKAAGRIQRARIVRTFLGAHAIPREHRSAEDYVDELIRDAFPRTKKEGLACRADIFIEDGYFSKDLARRYLTAARTHGLDLVVHADQLTRSGGAELAVEMKARSADHLLCVNDYDIRALAASEVTCVLLPTSDLYMNCPYPKAREMIDQGARVALATDFNPGSSPSQDVALVGVLARIQMKMRLAEVLSAYTVGAAFALGLERELGSLSIGKLGDFNVLNGPLEELFLEIGRMPIERVYSSGKRLM